MKFVHKTIDRFNPDSLLRITFALAVILAILQWLLPGDLKAVPALYMIFLIVFWLGAFIGITAGVNKGIQIERDAFEVVFGRKK